MSSEEIKKEKIKKRIELLGDIINITADDKPYFDINYLMSAWHINKADLRKDKINKIFSKK